MNDDTLRQHAVAAGLLPEWTDVHGRTQRVAPPTLQALLDALGPTATPDPDRLPRLLIAGDNGVALPGAKPGHRWRVTFEGGETAEGLVGEGWRGEAWLPPVPRYGYHRLELDDAHTTLAVAPPRCVTLPATEARPWGLAVQIASLRRRGDLGIGDYGGVAAIAPAAARQGAAALAVSPAHALYAADPDKLSPYAPSSRLFLNTLFADPSLVLGDGFVETASDDAALIDWAPAARAKHARLRQAFDVAMGDPRFTRFRSDAGPALEQHARFEALHAHFLAANSAHWHWRDWPEVFRTPDSPGVERFAREHPEAIAFHAFCQWLADASRGAAQQAAREAGMAIGLIADLAVGTEDGGSHAWSRQAEIIPGATVGAPPDLWGPRGQDWGLTAFSPSGLRASGYRGFLELLRAAMRQAGGIRIDHAMGLARLWMVPRGASAAEGAYLTYPLEDLLRLLALESVRHHCIVTGEDLGTVPDGFRERLAAAGILGMRVLWFEEDGVGGFSAPRSWPQASVALTTTHDLPTVAGWWRGGDIDWRERLSLYTDAERPAADRAQRAEQRDALWRAMLESGAATADPPPPDQPDAAVDAAVAHLGTAGSALAILPIEDALGLVEQPNLPGTVDGHPNWRRRLPGEAATLADRPEVARRLQALDQARRA